MTLNGNCVSSRPSVRWQYRHRVAARIGWETRLVDGTPEALIFMISHGMVEGCEWDTGREGQGR